MTQGFFPMSPDVMLLMMMQTMRAQVLHHPSQYGITGVGTKAAKAKGTQEKKSSFKSVQCLPACPSPSPSGATAA